MNIDELKAVWKQVDLKIKSTNLINDQIITSMIRQRSISRLSQIKRSYNFFLFITMGWLLFFSAVLAGNPFDFIYPIQYAPAVIYIICFMAKGIFLLKRYRQINIPLSQENLESSLRHLVQLYEQPSLYQRWSVRLFLAAGILFALSFYPSLMDAHGALKATGFIGIQILVAILMVYIAGSFKSRHGEAFREDLEELSQLKTSLAELSSQHP